MATVTETHTRIKMLVSEDGAHGMVPELKTRVDGHAAKLNSFDGSFKVIVWILGIVMLGIITLGSVFAEHVLGGKR